MPDLRAENHGSIVLLRPLTDAGRAWLAETAPEDAQFFGGAMVIEPRYAAGVVDCAFADGMDVTC